MKLSNPWQLALFSSWMIVLAVTIVYFMICQFGISEFDLVLLLLMDFSILVFVVFFLRYVFREFLTEKIKLIYKTIQTRKLTKGEKLDKKVNLKKDVLSEVENEVSNWAKNRQNEIDQLRKAETFRKEFLGNLSHELKTPLFNIQGYISTLLRGGLADPTINEKFLQKTETNIDRMISMVEELETISRFETGEIELIKSRFNILVLCQEVYQLLDDMAKEKKISLHFGPENQGPVFVFADRDKVRQVLHNLVSNSIKYGIENGRTKISFYEMDENILVEVSDNGIGIEEHHISRLFERFYRVDKSRSRSEGGSGLGLAIVKHIIEAHKQTLNVRSTPGIGSTFSFTVKKG